MKIQDKLHVWVASGFGVSLLLFILFLTAESWLSVEGPLSNSIIILLGDISLLFLFVLNLATMISFRTYDLSLRSPVFMGLLVNMTIIGIGILVTGQLYPFTFEDLLLGLLAMGRGEFNLSIKQWHDATGLIQWSCLLATGGAIWGWSMIVWQTWLNDLAAKYFTRLNRRAT